MYNILSTKVAISWLFTEVDVTTVAFIRCFCRICKKTLSYERNSTDIYFRKKPENNYFSTIVLQRKSTSSEEDPY